MAPDAANQGGAPQESAQGADAQPRTLGGFELLGRLGEGGMGTVLKARQVSMDRLVALKILPKKLAEDERFVQRFLREARSAARLRHPNIVQAHDVGFVDGYYFFAMEFVDGETLDAVVRREGPMEANRALDVMKQVTSALAAAHEAGIVHRDIKPSNIMIDRKGEVRVTDFGLAKRTEGDVEATADGAVVGTPAYVAPEMAKGGEAEARSDLYSLGATIFCALAGRPPFEGRNFSEVLVKQATEQAPPLASLAPRVDRRLCHVIDRLLLKDPEARYPSATALLDDLNGLGKLQSVAAAAKAEAHAMLREAPTLEMTDGKRLEREAAVLARRGEQRRGSKRRLVFAAIAVGLALLAALTLALLSRPSGPAPKANPELREQNAQGLFHNAKVMAKERDWAAARKWLDELASDYADTEFVSANRAAIEVLRRQAEAPPPPEKPSEPPPKQEPRGAPPPPAVVNGLVAAFYAGEDFQRFVAAKRVDQILFNWGPDAPLPNLPADHFSVRFVGWLQVPEPANYTFRFWRDDGARLYLDGKRVIEEWEVCNLGKPSTLWLDRGLHPIWVEYMEMVGMAAVALHWSRGEPESIVPADAFRCDPALLERAERAPAEDPLAGLRPGMLGPKGDAPDPGEWVSLFDGKTLDGWRVVEEGKFAGHGRVAVEDGCIGLDMGAPCTGIATTREMPTTDYELSLEGMRVAGGSDLCSVAFPVGTSHCALVVGGHGGSLVGLESIDGRWGHGSPTRAFFAFEWRRWYQVRLRVTQARIQVWVDERKLLDTERGGHVFTLWAPELKPLGIYCSETRATLRHIRLRRLGPGPEAEAAPFAGKLGEWVPLFDGKTLDGWSVMKKFVSVAPQDGDGTGGEVYVKEGWLVLEPGRPMTGIAWTRAFPETDYEVELEAMRLQGFCDFASFTFPAGQEHCTFHGACHAQFVGLSRVDGQQCRENGTGRAIRYQNGLWYRIRLQVTAARVRAWIDETPIVDLARAGRALAPHAPELRPFGVWNWMGKSAIRSVRVRRITPAPQDKEPPPEPPAKPLALPPGGQWLSLFDGKTLDGWRVVPLFPGGFGGRGGKAEVRDGHIVLEAGMPHTAIAWTGGFPTSDYEVRVEATRILGQGDFCSIVFPLGTTGCIWVVGGCRGSGIDGLDHSIADGNETAQRLAFRQGRPYQVRLRVTKARIEGWIDDEKVFDTLTAGHTFTLRDFARPVAPFGLFTWNTSAALRSISVRAITPRPDDGPPPDEPPAGAKPVETATVPVAARANWFDTGLYVTQGKAYELSASGLWGTEPTWPACGAEGRPGRPTPNSPLVGANVVFALIGRVGALGRPFHVGERLALTPETTGRLYLRMNDAISGDNWGSLRVTVAGPLLADADAPLLARFTKEVRKLSLDAKSDWADTGVAVQPGDKLLIAAAGTWQAGALLPPSNADGYQEALAFLRRGALVGKIGEQGRPFHVGQLLLLEANKAGKLYLAMNDDARDDNQGSLTVTISSPPMAKPPDGKAEAPPPPLPRAP